MARSQGVLTQPGYVSPAGYVQLTSLGSATALSSIPVDTRMALIQPEAQAVRWRDDGTNPSATVGMPLAVGTTLVYTGNLTAIKFIEQTSGAKLNIVYYT